MSVLKNVDFWPDLAAAFPYYNVILPYDLRDGNGKYQAWVALQVSAANK